MSEDASTDVCLDSRRARVCLEVAWEVDALAAALAELVQPAEDTHNDLVVRGVCGRMRRLAQALMGAVGDPGQPTPDLEAIVHHGK